MPHRKWDLRIKDILASIDRIFEYTRNLDFDSFRSDTKTVDAVVRNFEIIGEAAAHLPEDLSADHPEIPWGIEPAHIKDNATLIKKTELVASDNLILDGPLAFFWKYRFFISSAQTDLPPGLSPQPVS